MRGLIRVCVYFLAALAAVCQIPLPGSGGATGGGGGGGTSAGLVLVQTVTASDSATIDEASCFTAT